MARGIFSALTSPSAGDMNELSDVPRCRLTHNAAQSLTTATLTVLAFNTEIYDAAAPNAMHDTTVGNSRITIPSNGAGWYLLSANVEFAANATGIRQVQIRINGVTVIASVIVPATAAGTCRLNVSTMYRMAVGDYAEVQAQQTSGGALNVTTLADVSPSFSACWMAVF
jgi:hypothetical protein